MSALLDTAFHVDAVWLWFLLLPPLAWFARFVYRRTRPSVAPARVALLWLLRAATLWVLMVLLAEPLLSYLARRALHPTMVTLVDTSPSMEVEQGGAKRSDRLRRALAAGLGEYLDGPALAFASAVHRIDLDTLERLPAEGQATDLALALRSALRTVADPRLLAGVVLLSDGRHNLGADPVRVAAEHGVPIHVLGLGGQQTLDDVQLVEAFVDGPAFAGNQVPLQIRVRSWGFQDSSAVLRIEEGTNILLETDVQLVADGQMQYLASLVPPLGAGPHLLRVTVVPRQGELTPHNNQTLLSLPVRQNRLRVLMLAGRPDPESAFVHRTLAADSTLQIDEFIGRDAGGFYRADPLPEELGAYDAVILLEPYGLEVGGLSADLRDYVAAGGGLLLQATGAATLPAALAEILPTISAPATIEVPDREPLRLEPGAGSHPIGRAMAGDRGSGGGSGGKSGDPWQRLPPLLQRATRMRVKPTATVLLAASDNDAVVVAGEFGTGRVVHVAGRGFWRQSMFGEGTGGDGRTVRAFWRGATHWLAVAEPGGRVRASSEQPVYRSGQPAVVTVEVFDEMNEPLADADVELSLVPSGRVVMAEPRSPGRYHTALTGLAAGTHTFNVSASYGGTNIGQSEGSFIIENHTVESGDLRADAETLAAIARVSGGTYRDLEHWMALTHLLRPPPVVVGQEQRLGIEIRHVGWLLLLVGLLTAEWILRRRAGML